MIFCGLPWVRDTRKSPRHDSGTVAISCPEPERGYVPVKWRFWRKDSPLAHLDPHTLAFLMLQKVAEREFPFNKWRDEKEPIPEYADAFVELCVHVYQLSIFLDFLERKFGSDVTEIVKSHLVTLMPKGQARATVRDVYAAVQVGRAMPERYAFLVDAPGHQLSWNVAKALLSISAESDAEKDAIHPLLSKSLGLGRISAEAAFGGVVQSMDFSPETTIGLRKPQDIALDWSDPCGCFERHLQRRYMNPLFPLERRGVCTGDILETRARDRADLRQLQADCERTVKEITETTTNSPNQRFTFEQAFQQVEAFEQLIVRAAEIGDLANPIRDFLRVAGDSLKTSMREACPQHVKAELDVAIAKRERYVQTFADPFLAQMKRRDTPISDKEVVPSLLTEPAVTVQLFATTLPEAYRTELHVVAAALIANVQREGNTVPEAEEKLLALKGRP